MQKRNPTTNQSSPKEAPAVLGSPSTQRMVVAIVLLVALISFEIFNFDTTRFALSSLLGEVSFLGVSWAAILAIAFCAIDFAGLTRMFTPEQGREEPKAVWYLMGAWLLGATLNAVMTWWAVSLTLLSHDFGNEVLSREQLLYWVPLFVAVFVWLTRILFIGALSVAGEYVFDFSGLVNKKPTNAQQERLERPYPPKQMPYPQQRAPQPQPMRAQPPEEVNQTPPPGAPGTPGVPGRPGAPVRRPTPMRARPRR